MKYISILLILLSTFAYSSTEHVKGIYLTGYSAGGNLQKFINIANTTEINAFVIDLKDATGNLTYRSDIPLALEIGSNFRKIKDLHALVKRLEDNDIYPIARIVVFHDPILAQYGDFSIKHKDGYKWKDRNGHVNWVDPYNKQVWDYNIAVAKDAIDAGFKEIQWDYVRFPDIRKSKTGLDRYPSKDERIKQEVIRDFLKYSQKMLPDALITADLFGVTATVKNDAGIGQHWETMAEHTDVLLPMIYPSHYAKGSFGFKNPNANPYGIIKAALEYAINRTPENVKVRPWLQDFSLGKPKYGVKQVKAQIQAAKDVGIHEYVLWNARNRYTVGALK